MDLSGTLTAATVDLNAGNIDGVAIGDVAQSTGQFTNLTAASVDLNAGNIDGVAIGDAAQSTGQVYKC